MTLPLPCEPFSPPCAASVRPCHPCRESHACAGSSAHRRRESHRCRIRKSYGFCSSVDGTSGACPLHRLGDRPGVADSSAGDVPSSATWNESGNESVRGRRASMTDSNGSGRPCPSTCSVRIPCRASYGPLRLGCGPLQPCGPCASLCPSGGEVTCSSCAPSGRRARPCVSETAESSAQSDGPVTLSGAWRVWSERESWFNAGGAFALPL